MWISKKKKYYYFYIFIYLFFFSFSFSSNAIDIKLNLQNKLLDLNNFEPLSYGKNEIPRANPALTEIIIKNKDYLVLFNPTPFANITVKRQATSLCSKLNNKNMSMIFFYYRIGVYTNYYSCGEIDYSDPDSANSIKEEKMRSLEFIFKIREDNIEMINKLENKAEYSRIENVIEKESHLIILKCEKLGFIKESKSYESCLLKSLDMYSTKE